MPATKVKICGLTRSEDARFAARAGADFLGVVSVPGTPRFRTPAEAREVLEGLAVSRVLVLADANLSEAVSASEALGAHVVQLHGRESPKLARSLQREGPWKIWKAVRVRGGPDVSEAVARFGGVVDGLLLDGWHPRKLGGGGASFPWEEACEPLEGSRSSLDLIVAGGLHPGNVAEVVRTLSPDVVDVSSGVESGPGIKDGVRVQAFIRNVRNAIGGGEP